MMSSRAYPLLVRIFSAPGEIPHDLVGDLATESLGQILASVCGGDITGIQSLIENPDANEYVRAGGLTALLTVVACGERSREETIAYFRELFQKLDRTPNYLWSDLVCSSADLGPEDLMDEIRRAFEDRLVEPMVVGWSEVERDRKLGTEAAMERLRRSRNLAHGAAARSTRSAAGGDAFPRIYPATFDTHHGAVVLCSITISLRKRAALVRPSSGDMSVSSCSIDIT